MNAIWYQKRKEFHNGVHTVLFKGRHFALATLAYSLLREFYWNPPRDRACMFKAELHEFDIESSIRSKAKSRLNSLRLVSLGDAAPKTFSFLENVIRRWYFSTRPAEIRFGNWDESPWEMYSSYHVPRNARRIGEIFTNVFEHSSLIVFDYETGTK